MWITSAVPDIVDVFQTVQVKSEEQIINFDETKNLYEEETETWHQNLTDDEIIQRVRKTEKVVMKKIIRGISYDNQILNGSTVF